MALQMKYYTHLATRWIPSLSIFGASGGLALCYFTEWKAVLEYLPYYNGKYKEDK